MTFGLLSKKHRQTEKARNTELKQSQKIVDYEKPKKKYDDLGDVALSNFSFASSR